MKLNYTKEQSQGPKTQKESAEKYYKIFDFLKQEANWMPLTSDIEELIGLVKELEPERLPSEKLREAFEAGCIHINRCECEEGYMKSNEQAFTEYMKEKK